MSNLDISMLSLTKNTYFYRAKDHDINHVEILDCASRNCQEGKEFLINTVKENIEINEKSYLYSLRIFPSERTVYFINSQDKEVKFSDIIHAYIILIERDDFLAVLSKSCSSII
ncbi:hypothetical protein C8D76_11532 [Pasteurella langaaensis DSM 22999]|uniref:Uncharacterized protein n=1 Tax=Alitibacter langaaensis DSM 22999 TaxID=1122935 RepID=A0A2U0SLB3_9PAST|nr:hypothetical protein [Pasteurella langaaensis]PVX32129.1 hypothetical protein C8D76_11532 [Pasteurella langaaensis DSM 22999]